MRVRTAPPQVLAPGAPAMCPVCDVVMTPEHRVSDDTWRYPDHPSWLYTTVDDEGCRLTRDGRRVPMEKGLLCPQRKHVVHHSEQVAAFWAERQRPASRAA